MIQGGNTKVYGKHRETVQSRGSKGTRIRHSGRQMGNNQTNFTESNGEKENKR